MDCVTTDQNLLIVGGTGFIGRHVVVDAIKRGYNTFVLSLNQPTADKAVAGAEYLQADLACLDEVKAAFGELEFNYVINLGGYINHKPYSDGGKAVFDAHFVGVQNLVACLDAKKLKKFVQIGSSDEYGNHSAPQVESMRELPISPYSMGKVAAGQLLQMLHRTERLPVVILRLFLVYGPGQDHQRFLPQIISGCLKGESFATSEGMQLRDFCYIDDAVDCIFTAIDSDKANGEVFNLASGEAVTIRGVLEQVREIIGQGEPRFGEYPYRKGENMALYADISKVKDVLNWQPKVSLRDGLAKTIDFYRNN